MPARKLNEPASASRGQGSAGERLFLLAVLLLTAVTLLAVKLGWPVTERLPLVLAFALFCPGAAVAGLLATNNLLIRCCLVVGSSLGLDVLLPTGMLYADIWSPASGLEALMLVATAGALGRLLQLQLPLLQRSLARRRALAASPSGLAPVGAIGAAGAGVSRPPSGTGGFRWSTLASVPDLAALAGNAGSVVATAAISGGLGFVYWLVAARAFPAGEVGLASSAISAMILLGLLGGLGLSTLLVGLFAKHPEDGGNLLATALVVSAAAGGVLGLLFAIVGPAVSPSFGPLGAGPLPVLLFASGVAVTSASLVLDGALIGLLLAHVQLVRNGVFAVVKLLALLLAVGVASRGGVLLIYATWLAGNVVSLACLGLWTLRRRGRWQVRLRFEAKLLRSLGPALRHHLLNLSLQLPSLGLPVLVTILLGAHLNAYFYTAWTIAYFVFVGPLALSNVLYALGVRDPASTPRHLRLSLVLATLAALFSGLAMLALAGPVLRLFGPAYAAGATDSLRILALTALPVALKYQYMALGRIHDRVGRTAVWSMAGAALELSLAAAGAAQGGLLGFTTGWAIAAFIEAAVFAPTIFQHLWSPSAERRSSREMVAARGPVRTLVIDLEAPLPRLPERPADGGASLLVRLHGQPLGQLNLPPGDALKPAQLAELLWTKFGDEVNQHLLSDGLRPRATLSPTGLARKRPPKRLPRCLQERARFLATAPPVTVIVATRDRPELLLACLDSVLSQHYPELEVLVIDNSPHTPSAPQAELGRHADDPRVGYLYERAPGLSRARNLGLSRARHELVAFIDDDAVADPDWLVHIVRPLADSSEVACVTGQTIPLELDTQAQRLFEEMGGFTRGFRPALYDRATNRPPRDLLYPYQAGRLGTGTNMAMRRSVAVALGGFDPALGAGTPAGGGEDLFMFFRVIQSGHRLAYEPAALVRHRHRRGLDQLRRQVFAYGSGLTAFITASLAGRPATVGALAAKLIPGLGYLLRPGSARNQARLPGFPRTLVLLEILGALLGGPAYFYGRLRLPTRRAADLADAALASAPSCRPPATPVGARVHGEAAAGREN